MKFAKDGTIIESTYRKKRPHYTGVRYDRVHKVDLVLWEVDVAGV